MACWSDHALYFQTTLQIHLLLEAATRNYESGIVWTCYHYELNILTYLSEEKPY